jgi:LacI family transcriptional regulator
LEYASFATPKLTTIKQPFIEMGQRATEMLLAEITRKCKAQEVKMPVELIVRDSVKAT